MLKNSKFFLLLGLFVITGLPKDPTYGKRSTPQTYDYYKRGDTVSGELLLGAKDLSAFKAYPKLELELLNTTSATSGLPEFTGPALTKKDFYNKIVGHTIYGVTYKNKVPYALYFDPTQKAYLQMGDGRLEQGFWWIDDSGQAHAQWPTIHQGAPTTLDYYNTKDGDNYLVLVSHRKKLYHIGFSKLGDTENLIKKLNETVK